MKMTKILLFTGFIAAIVAGTPSKGVSAESGDEIMFILDASSSMLFNDGTSTTRIERAKQALTSTIKSLPSDQRIGVRVYGSKVSETNKAEGCKDSVLLSSPKSNNAKSFN